MGKAKALSNRQRDALRKAIPKTPRNAKPALSVVAVQAEPRGVAAREAVRDEVAYRELSRLHAATVCGDGDWEDIAEELGVETYVSAELRVIDRRGDARMSAGLRVNSRDGLVALHKSKALTDIQAKAGLAYRLCYELAEKALGSCLGRVGEGRGARDWSQLSIAVNAEGELELMKSAADLQRAFVIARLNQMERAVFGLADVDGRVWLSNPDGRELAALRQVAGEGRSLREAAGAGGKSAVLYREALIRALDVVSRVLRIGEH